MERVTQYYEDSEGVWSYFISGQKNPCGCGSNLYHYQYDGEKLYCVCNSCSCDIYEIREEYIEELLDKGVWKFKDGRIFKRGEKREWSEIVEEQKALFHKWQELSHKLSTLNDIIQNDFQKLAEDGNIDENSLSEALGEFNHLFQKRLDDFNGLSSSINQLCQDVISKLKKECKK